MTARMWCVFALAAGLWCSTLVGAAADDEWCGEAAWFDDSGGLTASGEVNQADALAAAHPRLPFGTKVRVDNLANGRSVVVRINDRASFARGRVILVSRAAAEELDMIHDGRANVRLSLVDGDRPRSASCGDRGALAEEQATTEPPTVGTAAAAHVEEAGVPEPADAPIPSDSADEVLFQSEGRVERNQSVDPPAYAVPQLSKDALADRFAVAFQPETWQEAEFAKMLAAFAPRIAGWQSRIATRAQSITRRAKGAAAPPGGLFPDVIAYLWSTEISMPHLARFEHKPRPSLLSQLTQ